MYTNEINLVMKNVPNFLGVYSRDNLPIPEEYPFSLICNTDLQFEDGTHWIAIYVDSDGKGTYFDSYAMPPIHEEFKEFLNTFCQNGQSWNKTKLQCNTCITCGEYCCIYIILRNSGFSHKQVLGFFDRDPEINDKIVREIFDILR